MTLLEALRTSQALGPRGRRLVEEFIEWHVRAIVCIEDPDGCGTAFIQAALARGRDLMISLEEEQVTA